MKKLCATILLVLLLTQVGSNIALADGMVIPNSLGYLEVEYHHVLVEIDDQQATTRVEQAFYNPYDMTVSGLYVFPLPETAIMSDFRVRLDGQPQTIQVMDAAATESYLQWAIANQGDPSLLQYFGQETYSVEITLPPHSSRVMVLEYEEVVVPDGDLYRYYYALSTERYSARNLKEVAVTVDVRSSHGVASVYSPKHDVAVERVNSHQVRARYMAYDVKPTEDFTLYYNTTEKDFGAALFSDEVDGQGYFMFLFSPSTEVVEKESHALDIVFVIDRSGSMAGEKIQQAKEALKSMVGQLGEDDRFSIVSFDHEIDTFSRKLRPAQSDAIWEALDYVDYLTDRGDTDIDGALTTGLDVLARSGRSQATQVIIFLTDGLPTTGVTEETLIREDVRRANDGLGASVHVFGVGYDVNTHLLDGIAAENHGAVTYIEPGQSLEAALTTFYAQISHPLLTDVTITFAGMEVEAVYPHTLPDLFVGSRLVLSGKHSGASEVVTVRLSGRTPQGRKEYTYDLEPTSGYVFVPRLWATRRIGELLDRSRVEGESATLVEEVKALGLAFGLVTPYTTTIIQAQAEGVASGENMALYRQDRDGDGQWDYNLASGDATVRARVQNQAYQNAVQADLASGANVLNLGRKNFVQMTHYAVDLELLQDADGQQTERVEVDRVVRFASPEYFALAKDKTLQQVLQAGPDVIFEHEGEVIAVQSATTSQAITTTFPLL